MRQEVEERREIDVIAIDVIAAVGEIGPGVGAFVPVSAGVAIVHPDILEQNAATVIYAQRIHATPGPIR